MPNKFAIMYRITYWHMNFEQVFIMYMYECYSQGEEHMC